MTHFIHLKEMATATDVAKSFLNKLQKLHGLLKEIVSDRDSKFTSEFQTTLCKLLDVKLSKSTAYYLQRDGQIERVNQVLEVSLLPRKKDARFRFSWERCSSVRGASGKTGRRNCLGRNSR